MENIAARRDIEYIQYRVFFHEEGVPSDYREMCRVLGGLSNSNFASFFKKHEYDEGKIVEMAIGENGRVVGFICLVAYRYSEFSYANVWAHGLNGRYQSNREEIYKRMIENFFNNIRGDVTERGNKIIYIRVPNYPTERDHIPMWKKLGFEKDMLPREKGQEWYEGLVLRHDYE
jgi:hypothetical protein